MGLDDAAGDRESQARAGGRPRGAARECSPSAATMSRRRPRSRRRSRLTTNIGAVERARLDADQRARGVVAERVLEQVDEDLLEPVVVGPDNR